MLDTNIRELRKAEVQLRRILLPGNSVNSGKREGPECSNSGPFGPTPMSHAMPRSLLPGHSPYPRCSTLPLARDLRPAWGRTDGLYVTARYNYAPPTRRDMYRESRFYAPALG